VFPPNTDSRTRQREIGRATRRPAGPRAICDNARQSTQRVVALVDDARAYPTLVRALSGHARVERAEHWEALVLAIGRGLDCSVVLELFATRPLAPESALSYLQESQRVARLVLLCHLDARTVDTLVRLPRPVADAVLVVGAHDDAAIRSRVLSCAGVRDAVTRLRRLEVGRLAPEMAPWFETCLSQLEREIDQRLSVAALARNADRTRVHLERLFAHSVHASPRKLIGLIYALVAVALLELRPRSLSRLAEELQFSSADSLCRSVRRSTGLTFIQISERGGLMYLLNVFNATFGVKASNAPSSPSSAVVPSAAADPAPTVPVKPRSVDRLSPEGR